MQGRTEIIGQSEPIRSLRELAAQVASADITVLVTGETGAGKEVLARFIHEKSRRSRENFIAVNCGAIPAGILESELFGHEKGAFTGAIQARKGYFESADRGTIFLDEIGEMPLETQVKFLRVIESGEFQRVGSSQTLRSDVRIIAATNRNLNQAVAEGHFREDLYYRLRSVELHIPPLRERGRDILILTEHFVHEFEKKHGISFEGFSPDAAETLMRYPWPGNVRELRNLMETLLVLEEGREISSESLERHLVQRSRYKSLVHDPAKSEQNELHLIHGSLLQLRQEVAELRQLLQLLLQGEAPTTPAPAPAPATAPKLLPPAPAVQAGKEPEESVLSLEETERRTIAEALARSGGNRREAAMMLGIAERTLYRKIKEYGL